MYSSIDFDQKYNNCQLSIDGKEKKLFQSGDYVKDWFNLMHYAIINSQDDNIVFSSSIDEFITVFNVKFLYLILEDMSFSKAENDLLVEEKGIMFFVTEEQYNSNISWGEFKKAYL